MSDPTDPLKLPQHVIDFVLNEPGTKGLSEAHPEAEAWAIAPEWFVPVDEPDLPRGDYIRVIPNKTHFNDPKDAQAVQGEPYRKGPELKTGYYDK